MDPARAAPGPRSAFVSAPAPPIDVRTGDGGAVVKVRVRPGASEDRVVGVHAGALRVTVRAAPERGKANEAVARLLARTVGARPSEVELLSGAAARDKTLLVRGFGAERLRNAILVTLARA